MIRQNLHCHTLFDDGKDSPETMVRASLKAGFSSVGVSLHCPMPGGEDWCCADNNEQRFIDEMHSLRELYAGQIEVWCGLEYDVDAERRSVPPYDYIIGSCHVLGGFAVDNTPDEAEWLIASHGGADRAAQRYFERMSALAEYPEVSIVGHFDLLTKYNERAPLYDETSSAYRDAAFAAMEKLCAADKIFELNTGAISRGWRSMPYPAPQLLHRLKSLGGRICISSDAHSADAVDCAFGLCEALARDCGFTELWHFAGDGQFVPVKL